MINSMSDNRHLNASAPDQRGNRSNDTRLEESREPTGPKPGGFKNDPDDPNNPNEVIERERESVRELEKRQSGRGGSSDKT